MTSEAGLGGGRATRTSGEPCLVFFGARWCDPAIPMRTIFDEVVRDVHRRGLPLRAVIADIDEVEARLQDAADDAGRGRGSGSAGVSTWPVAGAEPVVDGEAAAAASSQRVPDLHREPSSEHAAGTGSEHTDEPVPGLDTALTPALIASVDFLPLIVLLVDGAEVERFVGMLPKPHVRDRVVAAISEALG